MSADRIDCPVCFKNGSQSGAYAIWAVEATVVVEVEEEEVVVGGWWCWVWLVVECQGRCAGGGGNVEAGGSGESATRLASGRRRVASAEWRVMRG